MSSKNLIRIIHIICVIGLIMSNIYLDLDYNAKLFQCIIILFAFNSFVYLLILLVLQMISIEMLNRKIHKDDSMDIIFTDYNNLFHFFKNMTKFFLNI